MSVTAERSHLYVTIKTAEGRTLHQCELEGEGQLTKNPALARVKEYLQKDCGIPPHRINSTGFDRDFGHSFMVVILNEKRNRAAKKRE